ncbi:MAG: BREX system Lon protease-like protein BrxL [Methanobacteriota archaeon]|nr:MAG: BREX system Lon protease-like protein BrxL [Euryarchaeota archaeon]
MDDLETKIKTHFAGNVVGKGLMRKAGLEFLPRYVSEFILGTFVEEGESEDHVISKAKKFVNHYVPEPNTSDLMRHKLLDEGKIKLLARYKVKVDLHSQIYEAKVPVLNESVLFDPHFVDLYPSLLTTGMWGLGILMYNPAENGKFKVELADFKPFQIGAFDVTEFFEARQHFSLEEWMAVLLTSMGLNPQSLQTSEQIFILCRLLPLIRRNLNMAEFGPKSTGKTYVFRNHSSYAHVVSGSAVTPAKLIIDLKSNTPGLISTTDLIVFDEITGAEFGKTQDFELIGLLKDYMEGGHVSRGRAQITEDSSLMFLGNIDIRKNSPKYEDYVRELPRAFSDPAFVDRINGFIPGWKIPKISQIEESLSESVGLMSSYLGEALHALRRLDHPDMDWSKVEKDFKMVRNEKSVRKITEGLLMLLFPGVAVKEKEINFCLEIACNLRQYVYDQLHFLDPDEFPKFKLSARFIE